MQIGVKGPIKKFPFPEPHKRKPACKPCAVGGIAFQSKNWKPKTCLYLESTVPKVQLKGTETSIALSSDRNAERTGEAL